MASNDPIEVALNGWSAVPINAGKIFKEKPFIHEPQPLHFKNIKFPSQDRVVSKVQAYAKESLPEPVYNHSMRVFYFATTILKQQFPDESHTLSPSTLALVCLLHDLGATPENISATRMSFEFFGAIKSLGILKDSGSPSDQAAAVTEAIIRHQDLGTEGTITFLGQIIQLATIYDNVGEHPNVKDFGGIIHKTTRDDVNSAFPRLKWLGCFAEAVRKEQSLKPWCHTTHIPNFDRKILQNQLMKPYE